MPYKNEHAARVTNPAEFERVRDITETMRKKGWDIPEGVRCLGGPTKDDDFKVQAWRFKADMWTPAKAKKWLKDNEHKYQSFEEATGNGKTALWSPSLRLEKYPHSTELKAKDDDEGNGWIEGYASVWDIVDSQGERVRRGAFKKTIRERVNTGKVVLMIRHAIHGGSIPEIIGKITDAIEDDYGLFIRAELFDSEMAQDFRRLVLKEGVELGLSIGYSPINWDSVEEDGKEIVNLLEIRLYEITVTLTPALEEALITAAKSREVEPAKDEPGAPSEPPKVERVERPRPLVAKELWLRLEKARTGEK